MPLPVPPAHVASVRIVHYPDYVRTRSTVSPAQLDRIATARVVVRERARIDDVVHALDGMHASPGERSPDSRWGVTLLDANGAVLARVYFDKFGKTALIDGRTANVDGAPVVHLLAKLAPAA